jgi:hypothetical protein
LCAEDEAVVAELLRSAKGGLELVDAREFLPLFRCRKGLTSWLVLDDSNAVKWEIRKKKEAQKMKAKATAGSAGGDAETSAEAGADASEANNDAAEAPDASEETGDGSAAPAGSTRQPRDFSHKEDADQRRCLEMGMHHFPDFASVPEQQRTKLRRSLFPPTEEEIQWMHLGTLFRRPSCMIAPHWLTSVLVPTQSAACGACPRTRTPADSSWRLFAR